MCIVTLSSQEYFNILVVRVDFGFLAVEDRGLPDMNRGADDTGSLGGIMGFVLYRERFKDTRLVGVRRNVENYDSVCLRSYPAQQ